MLSALLALAPAAAVAQSDISKTPPMGWMSWEIFRCNIDCKSHPDSCINEALYKAQTDALVNDGYLDAGYDGIHIDDCWETKDPRRDANQRLVPDKDRFPSGFKALGDYMHGKNVKFAIYSDIGTNTCGGYPASEGFEKIDAETFAEWGVDYLKLDGCNAGRDYYEVGYPKFGDALVNGTRPIVYSCSWPAYLGGDETTKPFDKMIAGHCNLWRNWDDIQCSWSSLASIIDHWGQYTEVLKKYAGPGHWHDPDMLLIGNSCINDDEARTQLAIWSIVAAPLIMGNDLRTVPDSAKAILQNKEAIAVDQDPLGKMGGLVSPAGPTEVWARDLSDGAVAVGLYYKEGAGAGPVGPCDTWNHTTGGYKEACGRGSSGDIACFSGKSLSEVQAECCKDANCAGFSWPGSSAGVACTKTNTGCGFVSDSRYEGYYKPNFKPASGGAANITVTFSDVGLPATCAVRDIWAQKDLGTFHGSFSASVPFHGTGFYKIKGA